MYKILSALFPAFLCLLLMSCAQNVSSNTYQASEVGVASKVVPGVIVAKRPVKIDANSGAGGLAGTAAGAAAGSTVGGGGVAGHVVGAVGGAVVGGLAGNAIDKAANHHRGFEYIIRLKNKNLVSVVQAEDLSLQVNQSVLIIYGAMTRIIPDSGVNQG